MKSVDIVRELLGLHATGRFTDMERKARAALKSAPDAAILSELLGIALTAQRRHSEALPHLALATKRTPTDAQFNENLGLCYVELKQYDKAEAALRQSLALRPRSIHSLNALGVALRGLARTDDARKVWQQALELDPSNQPATYNLVNLLISANRNEQAEAILIAHASRHPTAEAYTRLAQIYSKMFRRKESLSAAEQIERLSGDALLGINNDNFHQREMLADALQASGKSHRAARIFGAIFAFSKDVNHGLRSIYAAREACDWDYADNVESELRKIEPNFSRTKFSIKSPSPLLILPSSTPAEQLGCGKAWARGISTELHPLPARRENSGRLKVGYFSCDFRDHVTAHLIAEIIESHGREKFEIVAYDFSPPSEDAYRKRLGAAFDSIIKITNLSDVEAADAMRNDNPDIIIDLAGWTSGHRAGVLALRPAPIQVYWLGSPGSTGAPWIDYVIADAIVIPPELESSFSENVIRMPNCYLPTDNRKPFGETRARADYGLSNDGIVFCSFNRAYKFTRDVFTVWMQLLKDVPDSVLWLSQTGQDDSSALTRHAIECGIEPDRIVFAPAVATLADHMARVRSADLALDCFPYGSHTTGADMLIAGVPMVALTGTTFASRVSASILCAAGFPELVTHSLDEYRNLALKLARDPAALADLKSRLQNEGRKSALFDAKRFTRDLENGLAQAAELYKKGLPATAISVRPEN